MTLLRTLRIAAALGFLALAGCSEAFSLAPDAGASGGVSSGTKRGSTGASSGAASGNSSGAESGTSSGAASGTSSGSMSGTSSGASSGSAPSGSSSGAPDAGAGLVCPALLPNPGDACPRNGFDCEYGTSPNRACNQFAHCVAGAWSYPIHSTCPTGTCPLTYDAILAGSPCTTGGFTCGYAKGTCICAMPSGPAIVRLDGGLGGPTWQCRPATLSCRSPRPNVGAPCSEEGHMCDYGGCLSPPDGIVLQCSSGVWQEIRPPCPA
jgi:hypothetical protein